MQSNPEGPREPDDDTSGDASQAAEEQAWRAIVENYGERASIDDPEPEPPAPSAPSVSSAPFGGRFGNLTAGFGDDEPAPGGDDELEERYEPPPPPPLPRTTPDRLAAWLGVFGSPAILLTALIFSIELPSLLGYALVAAFVGGFAYLVYRMPRGPRDPWDDGAQV